MTLLTAESITNRLKSILKFEEEKWSLAQIRILWNAYICLWRSSLLMMFRMTLALVGLFCWYFSSYSLLCTFITGTSFENLSSVVLLKPFHLIFIACQFTGAI